MANILTVGEAANVLRCEATDAEMLALLPLVDTYIKNATGRDWTRDAVIQTEAKSAARMLLVRWHEDPGAVANGALGLGLNATLVQLKTAAIELAQGGLPGNDLAIVASMPEDGTDEIAVTAQLVVIFNHMLALTAGSAVSLATAAGAAVSCTVTLDGTQKIVRVRPGASLASGTDYVLSLTAVPDVYGETLTGEIRFRTV